MQYSAAIWKKSSLENNSTETHPLRGRRRNANQILIPPHLPPMNGTNLWSDASMKNGFVIRLTRTRVREKPVNGSASNEDDFLRHTGIRLFAYE
ncbi:hypothetical protein CDAR_376781 [Caerostris darwini]|uniref:Uncharacterized protein n=1 Tax=Caerostris darwini TaxID=1538125 RepID=A0AAV4SWL9_9ARAC|nr:hypothetical protein CDAR_376781 [Caerostris darwini]